MPLILADQMMAQQNPDLSGPRVSMVLPCYNHGAYVGAAIQAVIDQDYHNIELIIIDDGSTDDSDHEIRKYVTACKARFVRFAYIRQENHGVPATLNTALAWMQGDFYACMASDDIIVAQKTSWQVQNLLAHPDVVAVFGGIDEIGPDGQSTGRVFTPAKQRYGFAEVALKTCPAYAVTQLVRLPAMRAVGGFDPHLVFEDWPMWLALTHAGGMLMTDPRVMAQYRQHAGNLSRRHVQAHHHSRVRALSKYPDHRAQRRALALVYAGHAVQVHRTDPAAARRAVGQALRTDGSVIRTKKFWRALGRVVFGRRNRADSRAGA